MTDNNEPMKTLGTAPADASDPDAGTVTVVLCGVGGQGTILAADVLAHVALACGDRVKISEIHGMAQRGGAVNTVVRIGKDVHSMVADVGCADIIVSFETTEALRNMPYLREGGSLIVNEVSIKPLPVLNGTASMPVLARESLVNAHALMVPADVLAHEAGNPKTGNVVLLGALSTRFNYPVEVWEDAVSKRVPPKTIKANLAALNAGRAFLLEELSEEGA